VAHADDGQSALNKGIERYGLADFKGSIRALEKAAATTTDPAALSRVHFYIGCNQVELKRPEEANAAFSRAVKLAPAMDPEPGAHKPAVIQTFRLARAAMVGLLRLRLGPGEHQVLVDGETVKRSLDSPLPLLAGEHRVEVRTTGYRPRTREVMVPAWPRPDAGQRKMILEGQLNHFTLLPGRARPAAAPRPAPGVAAPAGVADDAGSSRRTRAIIGYTTLSLAALAAAGAGALYGLGMEQGNEAHEKYKATTDPVEAALHRQDVEAAQKLVIGGHVAAGVAAAALGVAVYLFVTRPPAGEGRKTAAARATGAVGVRPAGVGIRGWF